MNSPWTFALRSAALTTTALVLLNVASSAQASGADPRTPAGEAAVRELGSQVRDLRAMVEEMRAENAQSRAEMRELRQELQDTRKLLTPLAAAMNSSAPTSPAASSDGTSASPSQQTISSIPTASELGSRVQKLEESTQLLGSKVDEQYQTKVETAAKYRARLSGIVLMNAFRNVGASDNLDLPDYAQPPTPGSTSQASFGATMRQTEIGLEIFGPTLAGAKTSANAIRFRGRICLCPKRSRLRHRAHADRQLAARLEKYFGDCRPGFTFHFAPFSNFLCVSRNSGLCLFRESLGLDAAASSRTSL